MYTYADTKWNLGVTYNRTDVDKLLFEKLPEDARFRYIESERVKSLRSIPAKSINEDILEELDEIDIQIISRIAMSKYLTKRQIQEFLFLLGTEVSKDWLNNRLFQLSQNKILTRYYIYGDESENLIYFYGLNYWGVKWFERNGEIKFHEGIKWYSESQRVARKRPKDTATDVKRILNGNQILLGWLKSGIPMVRFGVMETFRPERRDKDDYPKFNEKPIFRPTVAMKFEDGSYIGVEVIRDYPESYEEISRKIMRYNSLVATDEEAKQLQLVICVENFEHAKKVKQYLEFKELWQPETFLFTEDVLNIQDTVQSLYDIKEDNSQEWYRFKI